MKKLPLSLLAVTTLLLGGCIPSLNPLYTEKDLTFDESLIGTWAPADEEKDSWTFSRRDEKSYHLVITDGEKSSPFEAHLLKLHGHLFLDLFPEEAGMKDLKVEGFYKVALISGHLFVRVLQTTPTLQLGMMDPDWLGKLLEKDPALLAHQKREPGTPVITATTEALQAFYIKHWDNKEAWGQKPAEFKRSEPGNGK